jgi:16S rRNA (guanine527-N7)-methyltransferase
MDVVTNYFGELSPVQLGKLQLYYSLIAEWNAKINLISRRDIGNFYCKHIIPCLSIGKVVNFARGTSVIDVGTGGGLPGIPLAIANGEACFTLVDSIGKKTVALNDMVKKLALPNVRVRNTRVENMGGKFDYIIARAVGCLADFLKNVGALRKESTRIFYIKGGDFADELVGVEHRIHNIGALLGDEKFGDKVILEIFNV